MDWLYRTCKAGLRLVWETQTFVEWIGHQMVPLLTFLCYIVIWHLCLHALESPFYNIFIKSALHMKIVLCYYHWRKYVDTLLFNISLQYHCINVLFQQCWGWNVNTCNNSLFCRIERQRCWSVIWELIRCSLVFLAALSYFLPSLSRFLLSMLLCHTHTPETQEKLPPTQ